MLKTMVMENLYYRFKSVSLEQLCVELTNRMNNMTIRDYKDIKNESNEIKTYLTDLKENLDWFVNDISGE